MRTECKCRLCQVGCKTMPGYLEATDIALIDLEQLAASEGALVLDNDGRVKRIPTIVPKQKENGECVFFKDGLCEIHDHSPYGCRVYSACVEELSPREEVERHRVLRELLNDATYGGPYSEMRSRLPQARPIAERKSAFERLFQLEQRRMRKRQIARTK